MNISTDLTELGRNPGTVFFAGVKSILDIPRTLEYLESQGVCVATYKTDEFPAFFTETSGCKVLIRSNLFGSHISYSCIVLFNKEITLSVLLLFFFL
ncbi:Pseudouridine-5'-phosphate glycosidase [Morella rubra]|uniref:Pseudouridine-5'-phosphate glycosidase n=1 Tax=Morella rubra TaxID=262757 RepID=A0A6A1USZ4_9ROSI|nr:Pseudouridine-5'-phosphate glycosidase [Morella rubra]